MSWVAGKSKPWLQQVAGNALALVQAVWEDMLADGRINPVTGIFLGKNDFSYTDASEVKVSVAPEKKTKEQLIAESKMLPELPPEKPAPPPLKGEGTVE